jgi:hypothetical protein
MKVGDREEWTYHFYSGEERTDRVLPPEEFADYLDKEKPCLGICYGEGAFSYLVKAEAVPELALQVELPQGHKYLLVSNDGDPAVEGFDEITLKALYLED